MGPHDFSTTSAWRGGGYTGCSNFLPAVVVYTIHAKVLAKEVPKKQCFRSCNPLHDKTQISKNMFQVIHDLKYRMPQVQAWPQMPRGPPPSTPVRRLPHVSQGCPFRRIAKKSQRGGGRGREGGEGRAVAGGKGCGWREGSSNCLRWAALQRAVGPDPP